MIYLNKKDLEEIGIDWSETVSNIEEAVRCLDKKDFSQPVKPYLRYKNLENRIIAMPAYVGGKFDVAGIKWIASFPSNTTKGLPRAHSVVVLNKAETGEPLAVINTPLLSIIRTASVSGLIMKYYDEVRKLKNFNLGIVGFGPIGQYHLKMAMSLFGDRINKVFLYDIRPIDKRIIDRKYTDKTIITKSWDDAYSDADIFITCTVSKERYIDKKPKTGSLHLNVSLRDYKIETFEYFKNAIFVDDWDEVCRENTDIDLMHKNRGLEKENVKDITDIVCRNYLEKFERKDALMFNPMGMGAFDIAMAKHYCDESRKRGIGRNLK